MAVGARGVAWRRSVPSVAVLAGLLTVTLSVVMLQATRAQSTELVADGVVTDTADDIGEGGMPSSNPRVRSILAAHPSQFVVVCVAGCGGKPTIVQILPRPVTGRTAEYLPSAGTTDKPVYGPAVPDKSAGKAPIDDNAVVCIAGCEGRPGQIVQRVVDLPPLAKATPRPASTAAPKAAPAPARKTQDGQGNEPRNINP
jgi:hypothetical protein